MRLLRLVMGLLALCVPHQVLAQTWSEPVIGPVIMTAPLTPPPVTGVTYYVDIANRGGTCNNNYTTTQAQVITTPWCTIRKALATMTAGQRAYVRAGTHADGDYQGGNSGTAGNYITLQAYPGEQPIIDCAGHNLCWDGFSAGAHRYIVFNGFEIKNPSNKIASCIAASGCDHLWFVNGIYHDATLSGFEFVSFSNVVSNNTMYNLGEAGTTTGPSGGHDNIFEFNTAYNIGRNGDDNGVFKCGTNDWNCIIRYNVAHDNYRNPANSPSTCFSPGNCQGITAYYMDFNQNTSHGGLTYVYNNIAYNNDIGIQVWASQGVRIFNNIIYNNGLTPGAGSFTFQFGQGICANESTTADIQVYNNLVFANARIGFGVVSTPAGRITSRNNIIMNNGGVQMEYDSGALNESYNYDLIANAGGGTLIRWAGVNYTTVAAFKAAHPSTEVNSVATAPSFVNVGAGNFHLTTGSAGVNQGTPVALFAYDKDNVARPQSTAWDIGPYELTTGGGTPVCPAP